MPWGYEMKVIEGSAQKRLTQSLRLQVGALLPEPLRQRLKQRLAPRDGSVQWGDLRRTEPFSRSFGFDRGLPVDRKYIEAFLEKHANDIGGTVLEVRSSAYTLRYGGSRVTKSEVLDIDATNTAATILVDLNAAQALPSEKFDCIILTQTLQLIYEFRSALKDLHRSLKPRGVLLLTVPGTTKVLDEIRDTWYWSFSSSSIQRLLEELFDAEHVQVDAYGNVLTAVAFLEGLAAAELSEAELAFRDPEYEVIVAARGVRRSA